VAVECLALTPLVHFNAPEYWRDRAEKARAIAGQLTVLEAKRLMFKSATDCDQRAGRAEERMAKQQSM
jgi:hypothetical protein